MEKFTAIVFCKVGMPLKYRNVTNVDKLIIYVSSKLKREVTHVNLYNQDKSFSRRHYVNN